jgi:signal transduction histidine kinase
MVLDLMREKQQLRLRIRNNSKDFAAVNNHTKLKIIPGINDMREYAELSGGRFSIRPFNSKGTCIEMTWNLGNYHNFQAV